MSDLLQVSFFYSFLCLFHVFIVSLSPKIGDMDFKILNFVIFCVGSVADALKMSAKDVYQKMSDANIISDYIVPCYDVLHTFSREYIVEDLVDLMTKKGILKIA